MIYIVILQQYGEYEVLGAFNSLPVLIKFLRKQDSLDHIMVESIQVNTTTSSCKEAKDYV